MCFSTTVAEQKRGRSSLLHFGHSLTPHSFTTFPVYLMVGEEDCSTSESVFLHHPAAFVEVAIQDVGLEVVDHFTYVERRLVLFTQSYNISIISRSEKA